MTTPDYIKLRFPRGANDEVLQSVLVNFEPLGFLDEDDTWEAYFDCVDWDERVARLFQEAVERNGLTATYDIERFQKENWNKEWEDSITPVRVSDRIVITPSWHPVVSRAGDIVLIIDPKMSFGTGFHATTRLMLRLMERVIRAGDRVLDIGTGTGVLAIAAIKLGATNAEGMDIDEWSMENALENCVRNGTTNEVRIYHGSLEIVHGPYELVLSNITRNDNIDMLPAIAGMLVMGGRVVLSGFYSTDRSEILAAMSLNGIAPGEELFEDEWHAISGVKQRL